MLRHLRREYSVQELGMLRFGFVTLLCVACAPTSEDAPPAPRSNGGSAGSGPFGSSGGFTFNSGGTTPGRGGGSFVSGGTIGSGGSLASGGTTASGGGGVSGSSTGTGGTTVTSGAGGTVTGAGGTPASAGTPGSGGGAGTTALSCDGAKASANLVLYDGATTGLCASSIKPPYSGYWFATNDGKGVQTNPVKDPVTAAYPGEKPGKGGDMDCAMHAKGSGFTTWGGGIGFDVNNVASKSCPLDVSAYTGIRFQAMGTAAGTHGLAYAAAPNTIRVSLLTTTDYKGDNFGGWCTLTPAWAVCEVAFATAAREGYNMTTIPGTVFDKTKLVQIQFQASKEGMAEMPPVVSFDFWIDDVTFY